MRVLWRWTKLEEDEQTGGELEKLGWSEFRLFFFWSKVEMCAEDHMVVLFVVGSKERKGKEGGVS